MISYSSKGLSVGDPGSIGFDASGRSRVSQLTTLFDGKTLNQDNIYIWDNKGDGTGSWSANSYKMDVAEGEYLIRQAKRYSPYFSGKSQFVEITTIDFDTEVGKNKRVGYFSSSAVAPFDDNLDGFFIEDDGVSKSLKAYRNGTLTIDVDFVDMDNYQAIANYDWQKFSVMAFDFLWLGGAIFRFFVKTDTGFVLIHTVHYSGSSGASDVFMLSPNQPVRYEIRSTSGSGRLVAVCSQVSTEGSINEEGYNISANSGFTGVSLSVIGTTYPLISVRKKITQRDISTKVTGVGFFVTSANDQILWTLQLNPTLSAGQTYNQLDNSSVESAIGDGVITVTTQGRILASGYLTQDSIIDPKQFDNDYLGYLGVDIDNSAESIVLCGTPITSNITCFGNINLKEFSN